MWITETKDDVCPACGELLIFERDGITVSHRRGSICAYVDYRASIETWRKLSATINGAKEKAKREK